MLIIDLTQELKLQNKGSQSDKAWKGDVPKSHDIITSSHKSLIVTEQQYDHEIIHLSAQWNLKLNHIETTCYLHHPLAAGTLTLMA